MDSPAPSTTPPQPRTSAQPSSFDGEATYDGGDVDLFCKVLPTRWGVLLLSDAEDRPIQILTFRNLRQSVKRRLTETPAGELSKRVDYRSMVRRVRWRRVDSPFEADLIYLAWVSRHFPASADELLPNRPAWFVHVNPADPFPRYTRTTDLTAPGIYLGPIEGKEHAAALIEKLEGAFDLCRYHHILVESPRGRACPYKDMRRCPAPCDGSITLDAYRHMVALSLKVVLDPADEIRAQELRMRSAAAELRFELAGRIKQHIAELSLFGKGPYRHARRLDEFAYLILQRGSAPGSAKLFLATSTGITELAALLREPTDPGALIGLALQNASVSEASPPEPQRSRLLGIVAHHLFTTGKKAAGIFIPLSELTEAALVKGFKDLFKQVEPSAEEAEPVLSAP